MSTYKELVYIILDQLKLSSDDAYFNEDHVLFLLDKYRAFLLKKRIDDDRNNDRLSPDNYQTIDLTLEEVTESDEYYNENDYLRTREEVPVILNPKSARVYAEDYYSYIMTLISRDRMRHVGYNKYLKNIIYCSYNPNKHLYFTSQNVDFYDLTKVKLYAIFEDTRAAANLSGDLDNDILDSKFPLEESLIPLLIELIVKDLSKAVMRPEDNDNTANDDLPEKYGR